MMLDPNLIAQRQYEAEQQQNFLEAKAAARNFFEAMSKLDAERFAKLIDELGQEGMMRQVNTLKSVEEKRD